MSFRKLSDSDVESLIELWKNEHALWDVTFPTYANVDERRAALSRISHEMDNLEIGMSCEWKLIGLALFLGHIVLERLSISYLGFQTRLGGGGNLHYRNNFRRVTASFMSAGSRNPGCPVISSFTNDSRKSNPSGLNLMIRSRSIGLCRIALP